MRKEAEIKARVDLKTKASLCQVAAARELDLSDIVREALRDFLRKDSALSYYERARP